MYLYTYNYFFGKYEVLVSCFMANLIFCMCSLFNIKTITIVYKNHILIKSYAYYRNKKYTKRRYTKKINLLDNFIVMSVL